MVLAFQTWTTEKSDSKLKFCCSGPLRVPSALRFIWVLFLFVLVAYICVVL